MARLISPVQKKNNNNYGLEEPQNKRDEKEGSDTRVELFVKWLVDCLHNHVTAEKNRNPKMKADVRSTSTHSRWTHRSDSKNWDSGCLGLKHTLFSMNTSPFYKRLNSTVLKSTEAVCMLSHSVVSDSLRSHGLSPARALCSWDFPGKSTGVGCHFLLRGTFPTLGLNLGLLHCRQILYHLSHQGRPSTQKLSLKTLPHLFLPRLTPLFSRLCQNQMDPRPWRMSLDLPVSPLLVDWQL